MPVDNPSTCVSTFLDYDGDGDQDLVTASCNLLEEIDNEDTGNLRSIPGPVVLLKNTLQETGMLGFEDVTEAVFGKLDGGFWMGVSMADLNADDLIDFYFGNFADTALFGSFPHLLLMSQPDGTYVNQSVSNDFALHEFNWGSAFIDVDNDGDDDLVTVGTFFAFNTLYTNPGVLFQNDGTGNFTRVGDFGLEGLQTAGLAAADFNDDGSQDVMVVGRLPASEEMAEIFPDTGRLVLLKGTAPGGRHISFHLEGVQSNKAGIGASVSVCPSLEIDANGNGVANGNAYGAQCQKHVSTAASSFSSTHSPIFHFGVADGVKNVDVKVLWPSGTEDEHLYLAVGFRYMLREGADKPTVI